MMRTDHRRAAPRLGLTTTIAVRKVSIEESGRWLAAGWRDMRRAPGPSLAWGGLFVAVSHLLYSGLSALGLGSLVLPLAAGFLLVGPIAAVGLYDISRRLERGEPVTLAESFTAWRRNPTQIGLMAFMLLIAMFVWIQVALILFALFFVGAPPSLGAFVAQLTTGTDNIPFLALGTLAGGIMAATVFAATAVSLPMLLDRDVTAADAVATSLMAVRANATLMVGWAVTIALLTFAGIAVFFLGLAITLPLVGHASWHAYRSMVR